jgi:hypothetical protein
MFDVSLDFVLKQIFVDQEFCAAACADLDAALAACEYEMEPEERTYLKILLGKNLNAWPKQSVAELFGVINTILTQVPKGTSAAARRSRVMAGGTYPPPTWRVKPKPHHRPRRNEPRLRAR